MSVPIKQEPRTVPALLDRLRASIQGSDAEEILAAEGPLQVTVVRSVQNFDDVRAILDDLREGHPQFVSFESTRAALIARYVDMLTGAAYTLGGQTTFVGKSIYLLTPPNVRLEVVGTP